MPEVKAEKKKETPKFVEIEYLVDMKNQNIKKGHKCKAGYQLAQTLVEQKRAKIIS